MRTIIILIIFLSISFARGGDKVKIPSGRFIPMYGIEKNQIDQPVHSFVMDRYPVTEGEFYLFLQKNKQWKKENIAKDFADQNYLKIFPRKNDFIHPVVYVSWFSANAFCQFKGGRLPSTLEWEYVHAASEKKANAQKDEEYNDKLLEWYSRPSGDHDELIIGKHKSNYYGVNDISLLMWEWTEDFNAVLMTSDNRQDGEKDQNAFCGSSSIGARDKDNYSAFVRYSLRASLQAFFTLENLGFRCVYEK